MFSRSHLYAAAVICGILLLMAGVAPVGAQSETPTAPEAAPEAAPDAAAAPAAVESTPNMLISYQGTLRDASGNPVNDAAGVSHTMIVQIYDTVNGSNSLWGPETHNNVVVRNGHFSLLLGSVTAMSANLFSGKDRFLKLTVDGTALTPLQRLAAVPYAVSSNYANSLAAPDGDPLDPISAGDDGNVTVKNPYSLNFGSSTRQMLNLYGTAYGIGIQNYTQYFRSDSNFAWYTDGVHSSTEMDPGTGGTAAMVLHDGNLGIGTTGPDARVTVQVPNASTTWLSFKNSSGATKWHLNSYSDTGFNIAETGVADGRLFIEPGGNVGIGTTNPAAKLDVNGNFMVAGHKPIFFRTYKSITHYYFHITSSWSSTDWSCGIVSWKVSTDIDEGGWKDPLIRAEAYVDGGVWHFYFDTGDQSSDSKRENWTVTLMCVDNRLVDWKSTCTFNADSTVTCQ
jgi:hypothetical protein